MVARITGTDSESINQPAVIMSAHEQRASSSQHHYGDQHTVVHYCFALVIIIMAFSITTRSDTHTHKAHITAQQIIKVNYSITYTHSHRINIKLEKFSLWRHHFGSLPGKSILCCGFGLLMKNHLICGLNLRPKTQTHRETHHPVRSNLVRCN